MNELEKALVNFLDKNKNSDNESIAKGLSKVIGEAKDKNQGGSKIFDFVKSVGNLANSNNVTNPDAVQVGDVVGTFANVIKKATNGESMASIGADLIIEGVDSVGKLLKQQEELFVTVNKGMGTSGKLAQDYREVLTKTYPELAKYGFSFKQMQESTIQLTNDFKTMSLLSIQTFDKLAATSKLMGVNIEELSKSAINYNNVGVGIERMSEHIDKAYKNSAALGLNAKVTTLTLNENIGKLNEYGFKNGIQGLTEMVQKTQSLRMNMDTVFKIAEDVMDPAKAIEMSAKLSVLGGAFGDLANPLKATYDATNNVDGLTDSLTQAAASLVTFNSETQKFEIVGANLRRGREMATAMGISYQELTKIAMNSANKMEALNEMSKLSIPDDDKEFLYNLGRVGTSGKMEISIPPRLMENFGKQSQVAIGELTDDQAKQLVEYREEIKNMDTKDLLDKSISIQEKMSNSLTFIAATAAAQLTETTKDVMRAAALKTGITEEVFNNGLRSMSVGVTDLIKSGGIAVKDIINPEKPKNVNKDVKTQKSVTESNKNATQTTTTPPQNTTETKEIKLTVSSGDVRFDDMVRSFLNNPKNSNDIINAIGERSYLSTK